MEQYANVRRRSQLGAKPLAEIGLADEHAVDGHEAVCVESDGIEAKPLPDRLFERLGSDLQPLFGLIVVRLETGTGDRPAAAFHPRASLEIDGVKRDALPAPQGGGAAEHPGPAGLQAAEWLLNFAAIQILSVVSSGPAAAFDQDDLRAGAQKLTRDYQPSRSGADDAHISRQAGSRGEVVDFGDQVALFRCSLPQLRKKRTVKSENHESLGCPIGYFEVLPAMRLLRAVPRSTTLHS